MNKNEFAITYNESFGKDIAETVMISRFDDCEVISIRHKRDFIHAIGGTRFVKNGTKEETFHLAKGMSNKCLACCVPVDGFKTLVITPNGIPNEKDRANILANHIKNCIVHEPDIIFGPDMGSPELVMEYTLKALNMNYKNITGLPFEFGGLDIDKNGFTAFGLSISIMSLKKEFLGEKKVLIQGYGEVGSYLSRILHDLDFNIQGLSNINGSVNDLKGIDIPNLIELYSLSKENCLSIYAGNENSNYDYPNSLYGINADIFIPAARTSAFACNNEIDRVKMENPDVYSIENFLSATGVKTIVEAANHPLTLKAENYAESVGVLVLPDFIINCGGMIGCYLEWKYRDELLQKKINYDHVVKKVKDFINETVQKNIETLLRKGIKSLRYHANDLVKINRRKLLSNENNIGLKL